MVHVTVLSRPKRQRRCSDEERLLILAEAFAPGHLSRSLHGTAMFRPC